MKPNYNNVCLKISAVKKSQFLKDKPQIVFCGRSNVGKSSMINCLLNRKSLARTSAKPGKTATINVPLVIWTAMYCIHPLIVIQSMTQPRADNFIEDIKAQIEENELLKIDTSPSLP